MGVGRVRLGVGCGLGAWYGDGRRCAWFAGEGTFRVEVCVAVVGVWVGEGESLRGGDELGEGDFVSRPENWDMNERTKEARAREESVHLSLLVCVSRARNSQAER